MPHATPQGALHLKERIDQRPPDEKRQPMQSYITSKHHERSAKKGATPTLSPSHYW